MTEKNYINLKSIGTCDLHPQDTMGIEPAVGPFLCRVWGRAWRVQIQWLNKTMDKMLS